MGKPWKIVICMTVHARTGHNKFIVSGDSVEDVRGGVA